jgi:hypothetical protein
MGRITPYIMDNKKMFETTKQITVNNGLVMDKILIC